MADFKLSLKKRIAGSKKLNSQAIAEAQVLGNIFGGDKGSVSVIGDAREIEKVVRAAGKNHPVTLDVEGEAYQVLIRDIENETMTQRLHHVTFQAIKAGEKITAEVPVHLVGDSPGVREGLMVITVTSYLTVETTPDKIPESIEVDISGLKEDGDAIRVGDLSFATEVTVEEEPEVMLVQLETPRSQIEEEDEATSEEDEAATEEATEGKAEESPEASEEEE